MLDCFYKQIEENKDIKIAKNYSQMQKNREEGKISAFLTIEEGGVLRGKMSNLRNLYKLGVRLITLTWNYPNEIGFPNSKENYKDRGLTSFGINVIKEMNRLGMIIDVSHLSDRGFIDVAQNTTKPFIASHSNARSITNHSRNLTDGMIKTLSENGGVMGMNFCPSFLGEDRISRINYIISHIKHIKNVGGIDVIAIGTDYDGIGGKLEIENISQIEKLEIALRKSGFNEEEIEKIFYKNAQRVIKDILS